MDIFLRLLLAHLITDFFLQPDHWIADKNKKSWKSLSFYLHITLTGLMAWLFLWDWGLWYIALFIAATHMIIDLFKINVLGDQLRGFIIDQVAHLIVLVLATLIILGQMDQIPTWFSDLSSDPKLLSIIAGYLTVTAPVGYLVAKATEKWRAELITSGDFRKSLVDAGVWIGILERILVVTFVIFNQFQAIGFLIAAKSILRFSDKSEDQPRKQTEYVLIGTLISFTIALFVGLLIRGVLNQ